jgi:hypothetical protein
MSHSLFIIGLVNFVFFSPLAGFGRNRKARAKAQAEFGEKYQNL